VGTKEEAYVKVINALKKMGKKYMEISLILRILVGICVGAAVALCVPNMTWLITIGSIFVGALKAIAPVLVFVLVASALAQGAGKLDKRMEVRPRHLEGMKKLNVHIICAGGLLDDEGKMKGSALIMEFESRKELDDYLANEPYVLEKVWEKIEVEPINVVIANAKRS
jgi:uncharacterized protein YciI